MLDFLRIPKDTERRLIHIDEVEDVTMADLKESLTRIRKKAEECSAKKKFLQLFIYYGGHGTGGQEHVCLLNSEEAENAMFFITHEIKKIVCLPEMMQVLSFIDRTSLELYWRPALLEVM